MSAPSPAIVTQAAVRRLPRWALLGLCAAYLLAGFIGRDPWKSTDVTSLGFMLELAGSAPWNSASWLHPRLLGTAPEVDALLPYWLGAWAIAYLPLDPALAARLPFMGLLAAAMAATWYAVYHLARTAGAQPVSFAFGGEAQPTDYARAVADGALLAFLASLGLAQLGHEATPALAQLGFTAVLLLGVARARTRGGITWLFIVTGLLGLTLSGAPAMAVILAVGSAALLGRSASKGEEDPPPHRSIAVGLLVLGLGMAVLAFALGLWQWRLRWPEPTWIAWRNIARLLLWFTWPTWLLALWALWRWRLQLREPSRYPHLSVPLGFASVAVATAIVTPAGDRSLLLALPALAALAAFALPTLRRSVSALIDWFTLLFFTAGALVIWVVWVAMQTGVPPQPAANVARLAPDFTPSFSAGATALALLASAGWLWLIAWRVGRHRAAIWKSLVLPAGGAALCWLLLMTLWLPLLDHARSYGPLVQRVVGVVGQPACVEVAELTLAQTAALRYHGKLNLQTAADGVRCPWLIVDGEPEQPPHTDEAGWTWVRSAVIRRPTDNNEYLTVFRRVPANP